ncbi:hypothetical protein QEJ31_07365 [Pigmentibacter sp. JX0631]|uniref:hypothetical protein n=1 Tax=Pigmentibacter sp. JX0631 TaxID=2976982 RepID=UPI00246879FC|nr:hypothetical protein [Pigmentibacter sp. JX0631]WGL61408.1 hypothetical protein QEJ31_07365 [Pigmentibacter sp. JX0631]
MLKISSKIKFFIFSFVLVNSSIGFPSNSTYPVIIPPISNYLSSRSLGMGGANVAVADDENSIFDNPAGIGTVNSMLKSVVKITSLPNISYSTNSYTYGLINQNYNYYQYPYSLIDNSVKDGSKNNVIFSRVSVFPTIIIGYFQFGILAESYESGYTTFLASPQNSVFSSGVTYDRTFSEFRRDQEGFVSGFSIPLSKSFLFGASSRIVQRETRTNTIEANQNGLISQAKLQADRNINSTNGYAIDLGIIMPFKSQLSPKIGLSVLDVGDTTYQASNSSSHDEIEKMNVKAGFSINPNINKFVGAIFSVEEERINDQRVNDRDKIHGGCELSFGDQSAVNAPFSIRLGYGNQNFSAGLSIFILFVRLEFATYAENVPVNGDTVNDRRYIARLTVDLIK